MRWIWVRRAPNPRGLRSDPTLGFIGGLVLLYIVLATILTLLASWLSVGLMVVAIACLIGAAIIRAKRLDRRDAAERASRNATADEVEQEHDR